MSLRTVGSAMIKKLRWRGTRIETESIERIRWHVTQGIVLHDQVAEAIEDRLTVVDLDAHQDMRPVSREDIDARVARWHDIAAKREVDPAMFSVVEHRKVQVNDFKLLLWSTIRELYIGCQVYSY